MNVFVVLLVCGLQPSTVTKNSILEVARALDPPLELWITCFKNCAVVQIK